MHGSPTKKAFSPLLELARLFLRLGFTSFGGPAVHIAMMREEAVRKRNWLNDQEFLDLLSATNFIPGPNSTEMAIHLGYRRAGWKGLIVAGFCFILPAVFLVLLFAHAYVQYGSLPDVQAVLYGIKPVMIAILLHAIYALGKAAVKSRGLALVAAGALVANLFGVGEIAVLLVAAAMGYWMGRRTLPTSRPLAWGGFEVLRNASFPAAGAATAASASLFSLPKLFLFFLKTGSVLFGSGYVLVAFLRADLVEKWQWLSEAQLLDAIAVGQFTPGPVFTTATFIGYLLGGGAGAFWATLGIFLPAFVFVAVTAPFVTRLGKSETSRSTLDAVNAASLSLMAAVSLYLAKGTLVDSFTVVLALLSLGVLARYRVNSAWLVFAGGVMGYAIRSF